MALSRGEEAPGIPAAATDACSRPRARWRGAGQHAGTARARASGPARFLPRTLFGLLLGSALLAGSAQADACRQSSFLPGMTPLLLRHSGGDTLALQRSARAGQPTARVWLNGRYLGEAGIPAALAGGGIQLRLRLRLGLETWLGSVRSAYKPTPYVVVCGRDWSGALP